jgi:hypothetical protein
MPQVRLHRRPSELRVAGVRAWPAWVWVGLGLALAVVATIAIVSRPRKQQVNAPAAVAPLPTSSATAPTELWTCKPGPPPPPRQPYDSRACVKYGQNQVLEPGRETFGSAFVGVHRCQSTWLAECPKWLSWNTCRYAPNGDIRFDGDGYVVAIRIHRRKRADTTFDGGSFWVGEIPVELGATTLDDVRARKPSARQSRVVVDPEFGTMEVLTYDNFELEFDTVKGEKIVGAINLTR